MRKISVFTVLFAFVAMLGMATLLASCGKDEPNLRRRLPFLLRLLVMAVPLNLQMNRPMPPVTIGTLGMDKPQLK